MNIAIVTAQYGDFTKEDQLIVRRIAGALAIKNSVTVLLSNEDIGAPDTDGAVRIVSFKEADPPKRYGALHREVFGIRPEMAPVCDCVSHLSRELARNVPDSVQDELARAAGGNSPELLTHLTEFDYDLVLFAGYKFASTRFGLDCVPPSTKVVLLPLARDEPLLWLELYDSVFMRPDKILVTTRNEQAIVLKRTGAEARERVTNVQFVLNVDHKAAETSPGGVPNEPFLLLGGESLGSLDSGWLGALAANLSLRKPEIKLIVVAPRARSNVQDYWLDRHLLVSRTDLWRWMTRAIAFIDPRTKRILGREVLEAYLLATPVLVSRDGGANLEHADEGNGGLWFSGLNELEAGLDLLADADLRGTLGQQGREYAQREYGNSPKFIQRLTESVLDNAT